MHSQSWFFFSKRSIQRGKSCAWNRWYPNQTIMLSLSQLFPGTFAGTFITCQTMALDGGLSNPQAESCRYQLWSKWGKYRSIAKRKKRVWRGRMKGGSRREGVLASLLIDLTCFWDIEIFLCVGPPLVAICNLIVFARALQRNRTYRLCMHLV
jgi:hypothetical protein